MAGAVSTAEVESRMVNVQLANSGPSVTDRFRYLPACPPAYT
jgi:hypothetical protein